MLSFSWLAKDGRLVLAARGVRAFGFGFLSVLLFIYLNQIGFSVFLDGLILSLILVSGALFTVLGSIYADRIGRRRFLIIISVLMAISGAIFALTTDFVLLIFAALIGALSPSGGDVGSFQSIEQAVLPQTCSREKRNSVFALYSMTGRLTASAGALFSGLPVLIQSQFHTGLVESYKPMFVTYSIVAIATAIIYTMLSHQIENPLKVDGKESRPKLSRESKSIIAKLSFLIGIDSFAGGFILQSIISYWFYVRYGVSLYELSLIFFTTGVLSALAFIYAGKLADRFGAIDTMVFTHLPSSIILMLVPIAPTFLLSLGLYLIRQPLSLMDVPARQFYVVSVVDPSERTFAAGMTNVASNSATAISPTLSGLAMQLVSLSVPFFVCGTLKIIYDLALYFNFRKIKESEI